jgi:hypothetical protein
MNAEKEELHNSLKKLMSEICCLADLLSAEIVIGVGWNLWGSKVVSSIRQMLNGW